MTDIDVSKIKPGDTVRVRMHTLSMQAGGVDPIEFVTKAYAGYGGATCVANSFLYVNPTALTILEHIPARPDWADARVIKDADGEIWVRAHREITWRCLTDRALAGTADDLLRKYEPITVVLDADGNPPEPEPEWLDADALDKLPVGSLVKDSNGGPATPPREKAWPSDGWHMLGSPPGPGLPSSHIAPARLLWAPEGDR